MREDVFLIDVLVTDVFGFFLFPFASSPSVSFSRPPPTAMSDPRSSARRTPPADSSGGCLPMPSSGLQRPVCQFASNLCGWWYLAWVWVEGCRRQRPPLLSLSSLTRRQASPGEHFFLLFGFLLVSGFLPSVFKPDGFCRHSWPSSHLSSCPFLSLTPPTPSPLPCTTVHVPLQSLLTEGCFRGRSACPHPAGPVLRVGFLTPVPVRVPPPPPYSLALIIRVLSRLKPGK